jgi:hypothetical protein
MADPISVLGAAADSAEHQSCQRRLLDLSVDTGPDNRKRAAWDCYPGAENLVGAYALEKSPHRAE